MFGRISFLPFLFFDHFSYISAMKCWYNQGRCILEAKHFSCLFHMLFGIVHPDDGTVSPSVNSPPTGLEWCCRVPSIFKTCERAANSTDNKCVLICQFSEQPVWFMMGTFQLLTRTGVSCVLRGELQAVNILWLFSEFMQFLSNSVTFINGGTVQFVWKIQKTCKNK